MNIKALKSRIVSKYPNEQISEVLRTEPDEISVEELIGKVATWQAILDSSKKI